MEIGHLDLGFIWTLKLASTPSPPSNTQHNSISWAKLKTWWNQKCLTWVLLFSLTLSCVKTIEEALAVCWSFLDGVVIFSCDEQLKKWRCHYFCVSVCLCVVILLSLEILEYLKLNVYRVLEGCLKSVPREF